MTNWNLGPLLAPHSIAIVGASEKPDSWAPEIERSLRHVGFEGELYPINPKYDEVWGRPCRSSVGELPRGVDLAVIVVPARVAVRMVDECGAAGVRSVMVVSSGFAEAGDAGRALQAELRETALRHRLPVLGPNVEGFVNYVDRVAPYGTSPPPEPVAGSISVISQSGTVAWALNQLASDRGAGLRLILGVGNEAVLGLGDMFAWAAADRHTKVVCTYIETMRDVEGIGRGLDALRAARKPVLVCAPEGRSEAARRSIVAHTGALAGNTALRDAWLRGRGAILVEDPVTMFEAAVLLSFGTRMRTDGVAAALQSGGACTLFAEAAGAQGLSLPEFSAATKRKLRKALPHYASQNNPLDVTGQAAVETEMFCRALEALALDPAVGFVAFDAFPPREEGEDVWAEPVLQTARRLRKETGVVFASVAMGPLGYGAAGKRFVAGARLPFLQGHRAGAGAIRALVELQGSRSRSAPDLAPHPNRGKALRLVRGMSGPLDEARAGMLLELYGVRRPAQRAAASPTAAATAARAIGFPVAVKALAPELPHKAKLGGVRLGLANPTDVEVAAAEVLQVARRAGAAAPRVLVQRMATGTEVLVGAVVDESFGACITMRPGGALAEAGAAAFAAAPLTRAQALAFVRAQAGACALSEDRHDLRAVARAVEAIARAAHDLRGRLTSLEANPLLVGERGAIAVDALAEAGPPGVIYGLVAALGFGLADFEGAIAGRRIGSLWTVILGQTLSAVVMTAVFLATDAHLSILGPLIGFVVLNGIAAAIAYQTHYRALELGPVAVVSPIGSAYAVVGVLLAVVFLGERPGVAALVGTVVTVAGVALVSTDLREFRAGIRGVARGVPWALVSTVTFGVAGFLLGYLSQHAGWVAGLWASRTAQVICYIPLAFIARKQLPQIRDRRGLLFALIAALADIVGVIGLSVGSERGYVSVTLAASAVFPLVAVVLSMLILHERLVPNQYAGIALVVVGLLMLGA